MAAEAYPTPLAGQRITASLLRSMQPQVARKTSDTSRAATTATTADPHLQFTVVAGAVYVWWGWIKYDAATGGDLVLAFEAPSGSLGEWGGHGPGSVVISSSATPTLQTDSVTTQGYMLRIESNDVTQLRTYGGLGAGTALTIPINGMLRVGASGGTWALDWAQSVSNATPTTLYTDSYICLQRIA